MENRYAFWQKLSALDASRDSSWLITRDFNDILDNSEKSRGSNSMGRLFSLIQIIRLTKWTLGSKTYQKSLVMERHKIQNFIRSRLDRSLLNCAWKENFPSARCRYLRLEGSDHHPLLTYFNETTRKKRDSFRFDRRLREFKEIKALVEEAWNSPTASSLVLSKLSCCRRSIIQWTKDQNVNSSKLI